MHAVGYRKSPASKAPYTLADFDSPKPEPTGHDLLVQVRAISVNPVDGLIRNAVDPDPEDWRILGWDAAGVVVATGSEVTKFKTGDEVYYAGALDRPGTNAEFHLVDERIVGRKPASLDWAEAAALPLTAITAWETLFDRLHVKQNKLSGAAAILVIGGAGGVGSIAIQLARQLTDLTIIATASRPESKDWVHKLGAHHVIDHTLPLGEQIAEHALPSPCFVFSTTATEANAPQIADLIAPQGRLALIDDPQNFDIKPFKFKSVSIHWEFMFTRSLFKTADIAEQGILLDEIARLVDEGTLRTTLGQRLGSINATNLERAHELIASRQTIGKITLEGFVR